MELIEAIKIQAHCENEGELKKIPSEVKKRIATLIEERVPSGLASIDDWNEAIACFGVSEPETDCKEAKIKLLSILLGEQYVEDPSNANKWW